MLAIVHCRIKPGGALNVLEALINKKLNPAVNDGAGGWRAEGQWNSMTIFTLYSDRDFLEVKSEEWTVKSYKISIVTALPRWLNKLFRRADKNKPRYISSIIDYRNLMPFFPVLMKLLSWKLKWVDHVLISSYAVAKNIDLPPGTPTEIYFHQPMHYIWPLYDEYVASMTWRKKRLYSTITPYLRRRDSKARSYDIIYANSESTRKQISKIYGLDYDKIQVVHPPIAEQFFEESVVTVPDNYFFYINRLTKLFKHLDKIILMCNHYKVPLLIAGDGPDKDYLMSIAGPTITFVGRVSRNEDKISLTKRSRGVINIAHESFGIVTAEALLLGVPVFGYDGGATPELVDEKSGILTPSVSRETMYPLFEQFISESFDRQWIQDRARKLLGEGQRFWGE